MAKLSLKGLLDKAAWEKAGVSLPGVDAAALKEETRKNPRWVHVGPGNIFRAYIAALAQSLIESGDMAGGITALSTFDHQVMEKIYDPFDDLALRVVMHNDGRLDKSIIASVGESLKADFIDPSQWPRAKAVFADPGLQMVSFTITEKGYHITDMHGGFTPQAEADFRRETEVPQNGMAIIAALLLARFEAGGYPIALVSMDNFSHNGDMLMKSVVTVAERWARNGHAPEAFLTWIKDSGKVAFPWSMIDKITPSPDENVAKDLAGNGIEDMDIVVTDKATYISAFVNAEAPQYLVIEDNFPNGRPPLEKAGVYFVTREVVDKVERMKVCTCLNPLHTGMAVFGCLFGIPTIAAHMDDPDIKALVERLGYAEGLPVVVHPGIFEPRDFLDEVVKVRLPNPYIPDTPQRIVVDHSQKLAVRFGETIKQYRARPDLSTESLVGIPLAIAAWCRFLIGLDDDGNQMAISADPLLEQLKEYVKPLELGKPESVGDSLRPILSNARVFGCDLYDDSLGSRVENYAARMLEGPGAVRRVLRSAINSL